ncbi:fungal-specific transcription factor domain-containing protein [Exophiala viscosa]|uniref:Fungal-specific transcription factor domain-containing protein n=1 Tax=Exophiala viscosa TaxID=2486360 RepID=A0AAN6DS40_9EURO|nr:fungal-specific transcription factor domain-containing protein [Exophiala viscosa]
MSGSSRPRTSHACRECKRRKVRCDLTKPSCSRCAASPTTRCIYDAANEGSSAYQFVHATSPVDRTRRVAERNDQVTIPVERLENLEARLHHLTALVHSLQPPPTTDPGSLEHNHPGNPTQSTNSIGVSQTTATQSLQDRNTGYLDVQAGGRVRYIARTHWVALSEEFDEIGNLLREQTRYNTIYAGSGAAQFADTLISAPPSWNSYQRRSSRYQQHVPLRTLHIPDRSRSDALFEAYVSSFHPVVPLTHIPTLREDYDHFWESIHANEAQDALQTSPLILAALYAGAAVYQGSSLGDVLPNADIRRVAVELQREATRALHGAHFPRVPTVASLAAYLIIQGTWMRDEEPLNTSSFIGVAVRVAQMLGLHRDPTHFSSSILPIPAEIHRRVWWHVFHVDVLVSLASGLPPIIDRDSWDTLMVSELYEDKIGTVEGIQYMQDVRKGLRLPAGPADEMSLISPMGIWLQGKIQETLTVRELLNKTFRHESMTMNDLESVRNSLESLQQQMQERVGRIPLHTESHTYENSPDLNLWAKILLSALGDKNWWFLHSSLLHRSINQAWRMMMPNLQVHCCAFLEKYVVLACAGDFGRFQWAWPGNHQPLHAMMMVLKGIERDPAGQDVRISCTIIDEVMALCSPEGGITGSDGSSMTPRPLTEGGAEAWDLVRRLRARVWLTVGLDPDIALTREEVCASVSLKMEGFKATGQMHLGTPLRLESSSGIEVSGPRQPGPSVVESQSALFDHDLTTTLGGGGATPNINWEDWDEMFTTNL